MNETTSARRTDDSEGPVTTLLRVGETGAGHRTPETTERLRALRVEAAMRAVPEGIDATSTLEDAEERMDEDGVNWLPVVTHGHLVGLITRLDIRQALAARPAAPGRTSRR